MPTSDSSKPFPTCTSRMWTPGNGAHPIPTPTAVSSSQPKISPPLPRNSALAPSLKCRLRQNHRHIRGRAAASAADAVCVALEAAVPVEKKAEARLNAIRAFLDLDFGSRVRILRINALDTPFAWRDLTEVVEAAGDRIDLVMLPK